MSVYNEFVYTGQTGLTHLGCIHTHEYESSTVRFPIYEFQKTRVCMYFNGGGSHTYEYGLPVNFTRTSSFCTGRVFVQPV